MEARLRRNLVRALVAFVLGVIPSVAWADPPARVRLEYTRGVGAEHCPTAQVVRDGVSARLGWTPFSDDATKLILVTIARGASGLEAHLEAYEGSARVGTRDVASAANDCTELAAAMELAIAIAVDPLGMMTPPAAPVPQEPTRDEPTPPAASSPVVTPAEDTNVVSTPAVAFEGSLGGVGSVGASPGPAFGGTISLGLRTGAFSAAVEGRADAESSTNYRDGRVNSSLLLVSIVPCYRIRGLSACGIASFGSLRGRGQNLAVDRMDASFFATLGARIAWRIILAAPLWLEVRLDLSVPLTRTTLQVSGMDTWTTAPAVGAIGLALGCTIPSWSD